MNSVILVSNIISLKIIMRFRVIDRFELSLIFLLFCALLRSTNAKSDYYRIATTEYGEVQGILKTTLLNDVDYYAFKGIPYAESPVGKLRFKVSNLFFSQKLWP